LTVEFLLPGAAAGLCLVLAWSMLRRYAERRRIHELIWGATFGAFGAAAGTELYASLFGWTPALVRLYYLAGASLSVGFLALGTLVLLIPRRLALVALGVVLVQSVFMVFLVMRSSVDPAAVQVAGWSALSKDGSLRALALTINVLGTLIVMIGTFGSAYAQWVGGNGGRAFGVLLIGVGTLTVATGGSLTQYGHHWLYGPMVLGLLIIYAGYRRVTAPAGQSLVKGTDRDAASESGVDAADGTIRVTEAGREAWQSHSRS
jgi:hypothetical protein